jgi:hypothetical protein
MKIYLAGPMRGIPHFNFPAFDYAAEKLRAMGFDVFSPADNDRAKSTVSPELSPTGDQDELTKQTGFSLRNALADDTRFICKEADIIALLPGWEKSKGATAEHALSVALGHTVMILGADFKDPDAV